METAAAAVKTAPAMESTAAESAVEPAARKPSVKSATETTAESAVEIMESTAEPEVIEIMEPEERGAKTEIESRAAITRGIIIGIAVIVVRVTVAPPDVDHRRNRRSIIRRVVSRIHIRRDRRGNRLHGLRIGSRSLRLILRTLQVRRRVSLRLVAQFRAPLHHRRNHIRRNSRVAQPDNFVCVRLKRPG